jgi:hypothetical protein
MVAATLAIGTITTVARFYTRFVIVKSAGIDDWFALLSLVSRKTRAPSYFQNYWVTDNTACSFVPSDAELQLP